MEIKNEQGQTMVEYILLLVVSISLVMTFYKSDFFKRFFGEQGALGKTIKEESEFGYRHAYLRNRPTGTMPNSYFGPSHPSYQIPDKAENRFFGAKDPYK